MIRKICCIGAGYVGGPTMSFMAYKVPSIEVNVVDINQKRIEAWNSDDLDKLPIFEPGLKEVIKKVRGKNLHFNNEVDKAISEADMIFISVNTPIKQSGIGAGYASDLRYVEASARRIAKNATGHTIVVEKSTLPVKTAETITKILFSNDQQSSHKTKKSFSVLSNPEFLSEGNAISDLAFPDRVLIGGEDLDAMNKLKEIYLNWVDNDKIIFSNLWSSELSKLTANAFLAQRISSMNSISAICEITGGNISEVEKAIGLDSRIGEKFLKAGPGFGGSCFKKDILNLVYLCRSNNLDQVADYWQKVVEINEWQKKRIYKKVVCNLFGNVSGKKIVILGFAFKANTNDTRESPSIQIIKDLLQENAEIIINDPKVADKQVFVDLLGDENPSQKKICIEKDVYKASIGADAIILLTEWDEYKFLDWSKISSIMNQPAWLFDTRCIINKKEINNTSLNFWQLGDGFTNQIN